jgi:Protein of unknown function (DUF2510)
MTPETPADELTAVSPAAAATTPAGWFPDPERGDAERYWDGQQWTDQFRPVATAPEPPAPPAAPSQADIEAEARARKGATGTVHEVQATVSAPVAPATPPAPEPPAQVVPVATATAPLAAPAAIPAGPPSPETGAEAPSARIMDPAWPYVGYSGPQPWEAENTPTLKQEHRMLSPGASGHEVVALAALLGQLGYASTITAGQNPHAIYDSGVTGAVEAFCRDYGVQEDPAIERARTPQTVGPWIWEALVRAAQKKAAEPVTA